MSDVLKILVVDDEPGMRMGVARALREYHFALPEVNGDVAFRVTAAESGEEALEAVKASAPDMILLDHKLPGMSGLETLDKVVEVTTNLAVIMITAYASLDTAVSAVKRGRTISSRSRLRRRNSRTRSARRRRA